LLTDARTPLYDGRDPGAIAANDNFSIVYAMKISLLVLDGVFDTGLAAVLDAFTTANELGTLQQASVSPFETRIVGVRRQVSTAHGLRVPVELASAAERPDWVIVPALNTKMPEQLIPAARAPRRPGRDGPAPGVA